jgi:hypothetical protein
VSRYTKTNEVRYSDRSWAYLHIVSYCVIILFDEDYKYEDGAKF